MPIENFIGIILFELLEIALAGKNEARTSYLTEQSQRATFATPHAW